MIGGTVGLGRRWAESRMTQTWRIGTITDGTDPVTLDPIRVFDAVYDGPARFKPEGTAPQSMVVAGQVLVEQTPELHVPAGTTGVEVGMLAVCDACPEDDSLVGVVVKIESRPTRGQVTAARMRVSLTGEQIVEGS